MSPSTGSAPSEASKYPPTEFSLKYAKVLAPNGKLVTPDQVFGEGGMFDKDVEEKTKLAFKVTMKKELRSNISLLFSLVLLLHSLCSNLCLYISKKRYLKSFLAGETWPSSGGEQRAVEAGEAGSDCWVFPEHSAQDVARRDLQDQVEQEGEGGVELGRLVGDAREGESVRQTKFS